MTKAAKLTKSQISNLNRIWTERVAFGTVAEDRSYSTAIDARMATKYGFAKMHRNAQTKLIELGLVRVLVTKVGYAVTSYGKTYTGRITVCVLTDAGRAAIGV
jgi:hypothetical protein